MPTGCRKQKSNKRFVVGSVVAFVLIYVAIFLFAPSCDKLANPVNMAATQLYADAGVSYKASAEDFVCGDANGNGVVNIQDVSYIENFLYKGGPAPDPMESADENGDGLVNIQDVSYLINFLYKGGASPFCGAVTDESGNVYPVIKICDQYWMAKNLMTTKYADGTNIPLGPSGGGWDSLTNAAYCNPYQSLDSVAIYGRMYNWWAAQSYHELAPIGWRVPTDTDFANLKACLGDTALVGKLLKQTGTIYWDYPNPASDSTRFNALGAGIRTSPTYENPDGYTHLHTFAYFWTHSSFDENEGWGWNLHNQSTLFSHGGCLKKQGFSVRCIRN